MYPADYLQKYIESVVRHRKCLESGDSESANATYYEIRELLNKIKGGPDGLSVLKPLLKSDDMNVRSIAASHLLGTCESEAMSVLAEVAKGTGLASFEAEMAMREWCAGRMLAP
jgi:hypothetical protein